MEPVTGEREREGEGGGRERREGETSKGCIGRERQRKVQPERGEEEREEDRKKEKS